MCRLPGFRDLVTLALLCLFCAGIVGCGTQSSAAVVKPLDGVPITRIDAASPTPTAPIPRRLVIPSISVDASVEQVGISSNGDLQTPSQSPWIDTGWYNGGPLPGERGSAVIDGHLDRPGGYPAVFWRLRDLHVGNEVDVVDSAGKTLRFQVTDVAYYTPQNAPLQIIFGNSAGKYLNLITCAGDWIPDQHQTTLRLVVYTTLI